MALVLTLACARGASAVTSLADTYEHSVEIVTSNLVTSSSPILYDFPMLVRLDPSALHGFDYATVGAEDIRFELQQFNKDTGALTGATTLPYDVDTWDTAGTSLVWVCHAALNNAPKTKKLMLFWGLRSGKTAPANDPKSVWADQAAVWHLASYTDSTGGGHSFSAWPRVATGGAGAVGAGITGQQAASNDYLLADVETAFDATLTNAGYTVSMWLKPDTFAVHGGWLWRLGSDAADGGSALAGARFVGGSESNATVIAVYPGTSSEADVQTFAVSARLNVGEWSQFVFAVTNGSMSLWINGTILGEKRTLSAPLGSARVPLGEGDRSVLSQWSFDEVRLGYGPETTASTSDQRVFVGYRQVAETNAYSFGRTMTDGKYDNWWVSEPTLSKTVWNYGEPSAEVALGEAHTGEVTVAYCNLRSAVTNDTMPSASGYYRAVFSVAGTDDTWGLVKTVDFTIKSVPPAEAYDFKYRVPMMLPGFSGAEAVTNFPLLVRVSEASVTGFRYADVPFDGDDIRFIDGSGNVLDHEIDTWDETGESTFWVRIPLLTAATELTMCWGQGAGTQLAAANPTGVWTNYIAVWHMNVSGGKVADSTGHNLGGEISSSGELESTNALAVGRAAFVKAGTLLAPDYEEVWKPGAVFEFEGWYSAPAATYFESAFAGKCLSSSGWSWQMGGTPTLVKAMVGTSQIGAVTVSSLAENSHCFGFIGVSGRSTALMEGGAWSMSYGYPVVANSAEMLLASEGFVADEVRVRNCARSARERQVSYAAVTNAAFCFFGSVAVSESLTVENRWTTKPAMSVTEFEAGVTAEEIEATITTGAAYNGSEVTVSYFNRSTGETLTETPSAPGDYRATFSAAAGGGFSDLTSEIYFRIVRHYPAAAEVSVNSRTLLANDDYGTIGGDTQVSGQSYDSGIWTHTGAEGYESDWTAVSPYYNFLGGTTHVMAGPSGERIWGLENIRLGNNFPVGGGSGGSWRDELDPMQNYLPWSRLSAYMTDEWNETYGYEIGDEFQGAGQLVFRNVEGAAVHSQLYTNGIGTVYFDAVNGGKGDIFNADGTSAYKLVLEVATNCVAELWLTHPELDPDTTPPRDDLIATHYAGTDIVNDYYALANWQPVTMHVIRFDGTDGYGVKTNDLGETEELVLECNHVEADGKGSCDNFYRVYAKLDILGSARIRLRRTAVSADYSLQPDMGGLILADNLIVSTPTGRSALEPYGRLDETKTGKAKLGIENAFSVPFPSVGDEVYARGRASAVATRLAPSEIVTSARMHYRWRYLNQKSTVWSSVDLNPSDPAFAAFDPLSLAELPGDIEFWYEINQSGEFYSYCDYTGTALGVPGFTEEVPCVTNRCSGTRDWFVRIRDGKSDYASLVIHTRGGGREDWWPMEVTGDNAWRGYVLTTNAIAGGLQYRVEARDLQEAGLTNVLCNTNIWCMQENYDELPASGKFAVDMTTNDWATIPCDAATGYILMQIDDQTRGCTIVHADYENFNAWHDAAKSYFVGTSSANEGKSGASHKTRSYRLSFSGFEDTEATDESWNLDFTDLFIDSKHKYDTLFASATHGGYNIGRGRWIYGNYEDPVRGRSDLSDVVLQMAARGEGYVQMMPATSGASVAKPRGLESVKFNARIVQNVNGTTPAVGSGYERKTDYAFFARTAFDTAATSNFTGRGTVSLVGYWRQNGFYEVRFEQIEGEYNDVGWVLGPKRRGQRLSIVRWNRKGEDEWTETTLYSTNNAADAKWAFDPPTTYSVTNNLTPLMISVYPDDDGNTCILAGVRAHAVNSKDTDSSVYYTAGGDKTWFFIGYCDDSSERLRSGSFGVASANCAAKFVRPVVYDGERIAFPSATISPGTGGGWAATSLQAIDAINFTPLEDDFDDGWWENVPARVAVRRWDEEHEGEAGWVGCYGFEAVTPTQTVVIAACDTSNPSDTSKRADLARVTLTGFGKPGDTYTVDETLWYVTNALVEVRTAGDIADKSGTDVAIYDLETRQWRGEDWLGSSVATRAAWGPTNFVFTSGWVTDGAVELNARRTKADYPCSIRSPLMDGRSGRGVGLGMIQFTYRNAQPNAKLLLQVCTNVVDTELEDLTKAVADSRWVTVTNFDFSTLPTSGVSPQYYLGMHGVKGMMRLLVDPELVESVASSRDESLFGSVQITEVFCRDEPSLDAGCWWGWNLRTIGDADALGNDTEKKMYLPDPDESPAGLSAGLNNSIVTDIDPSLTSTDYSYHMPFIQSPTFTNAIVGEVKFKARKYDLSDYSQPAEIRLYGTARADLDELGDLDWDDLGSFVISNTTYATFSVKTDPGHNYRAFRFAVTGVYGTPGQEIPQTNGPSVRVLIDEVTVMEAIRARLAFRNVGAFRSDMAGKGKVEDVPSRGEQPLCGENWGVQAEVYAAMLGDEIDRSYSPQVKLHWYEGTSPWGYENWKDLAAAKSADLAEADDAEWVFRSSLISAPDAVILPSTDNGTVVQYTLEVVYKVTNAKTGVGALTTNWLSVAEGEWKCPEWFSPVDYNTDPAYGAGEDMCPFTILDAVAPGWAWLNEVNILGELIEGWDNSDQKLQYVEVAAPAEADLTGWKLRLLDMNLNTGVVATNDVAQFGDRDLEATKDAAFSQSNMVFFVIANDYARKTGELKRADGTFDGSWDLTSTCGTFDIANEVVECGIPFGIQLVRASGVVEHEIVAVGTNIWGSFVYEYQPSNVVAFLNRRVGSKFFFAGSDNQGRPNSLSVLEGSGEEADYWHADIVKTPGRVNAGQVINPDHPTPSGESILLYATVDTTYGHVRQTVGRAVDTNTTQIIVLQRGNESGTNITYTTDRWYGLGKVTQNGKETAIPSASAPYTWVVNVGRGATENTTVIAYAGVDSKLVEYGVDENNPYTPAVIDWLTNHKTLKWGDFANDDGTIALAKFRPHNDPSSTTNMTLTQMYWLDIDPTASNMVFESGIHKIGPTDPVGDPEYEGDTAVTNTHVTMFMMITNETEDATSMYYRQAWSPYVLRDLQPGVTSLDYTEDHSWAWTSVTFKVRGILGNGLTSIHNEDNWQALRWFVFHEDSFYQPGNALGKEPFTSEIDILDPVNSKASPGYGAGWYDWVREHGPTPVYFGWQIDTKLRPFGVDVLKTSNPVVE